MDVISNNVSLWDFVIQSFPVLIVLFIVVMFLYFMKNILND